MNIIDNTKRGAVVVNKVIDEQQLKAVCDVLGETNLGYTKTELTRLLEQSNIQITSDGKSNNGYIYQMGLNKRDWLYNCLANEINIHNSLSRVYVFLEKALNPVSFTDETKRSKYEFLLEGVNKALLMAGLEMSKEGKLVEVVQAKTLDEAYEFGKKYPLKFDCKNCEMVVLGD